MKLGRVILQVVKLVEFPVTVEPYEFVSFRPHSEMSHYHVLGRIFVEMVEQ